MFVEKKHIKRLIEFTSEVAFENENAKALALNALESLRSLEILESNMIPVDRAYQVGSRVMFENGEVRLWEIEYEPGESSGLHEHILPYCFLIVQGTHLKVFDQNGDWIDDLRTHPGDCRFFQIGDNLIALSSGEKTSVPSLHTVKNDTSEVYREVLIEFKKVSI